MWILYYIIKLALVLILPFACLIRSATYVHVHHGVNAWTCLLISAIITSVVMFIYFTFFYGKLTGKIGGYDSIKRRWVMAFILVLVYCINGILFFSTDNLKHDKLHSEMSSLHPILRLSLSTIVYLDKDLLITDASRLPEDYTQMGLPSKRASLHYKQPTSNYAHAVDLRTKNRNEIKNSLITLYFRCMGFNTLRHGGTADHLHVSLMSHDYPHAK